MKQLNVELEQHSYPIIVTSGFEGITQYIVRSSNKCVIITDQNVADWHLDTLCEYMKNVFEEVLFYIVEPGENSKSLKTAEAIYNFLQYNQICRSDTIITMGGGVVGDLGGFVAATFMRGIRFIQVPTSLLAQVDSSVGGKTAVNLKKTKNVIGSFYQPALVYINYSVLKTLPIEEIRNGLVEIIVHAIIKDEELFCFIEDNLDKIMELDFSVLEKLIYWNCNIKRDVVQRDEVDVGERAILNFGHTFGHALESYYDYKYRHGECVAIGIIGACYLAERMGLITKEVTTRIRQLIEHINVFPTLSDCNQEGILKFLLRDKKFTQGKIYFILPRKIGNVEKFEIQDMDLMKEVCSKIVKEFVEE